MLTDVRLRLRAFFKRSLVDRELDDELRFHVDRQIDTFKRAGFDEIEATRRAQLQFGGVAQMKEAYRDQRGLPMIETFWRDVTYAVRTLRRSPGFTLAAATILALGIGATSAIFSLVDATLLRPLPFCEPDRLVMVWETLPRFSRNRVAPLNFTDWSEQNQTFASMAAAAVGGSVTLSDAQGLPESIPSQTVTGGFFDVLGIRPLAGRAFVNDDMRGGANVALMSEGIWRRRFGADPGVVGRAIPMGAQTLTIIGIMPDTFKLFSDADFWLPLGDIPRSPSGRRNHFLLVVGRLRPDATIASAHADLARVAANIAAISPDTNRDVGVHIEPLRDALVTGALVPGGLRLTTIVLGGIVALVLLLACANVANLLLARGVSRTREVAVRAALGGSPWRIIQQLLTENLVLAGLGGATGLVIAWVAIRSAPSILPPRTIPAGVTLMFDRRLTLFATLLTLVTAVIVGLMPAWRASRVPLAEATATGGRGSTEHSVALRRALTVIEIAVAVLLTTGAALLVRTLVSLDRVDGGYRGDGVLTAQMGLNFVQYPTSERRFAVLHAIEDEISRVPGVRVAALTTDLPMDGFNMGQFFTIDGDSERDPMRHPAAHYQLITPRLFEALGIPLVRGRPFSDRDTPTSLPVCIVNEEFARRYLSHRDPIGARITVQTVDVPPMTVTREVVGVSRQVKEAPGAQASQLEIYVPVAQNAWYFTTIVARTTGNPWSFVPALKAAVRRVQPDTALLKVRTMDDVASEATAAPRFRARFVTAFALLAIVLAAGGIFSVFTFTVQQRAREFSIRMALGARSGDVLRLVLADGAKMIAIGLAIGMAGSAALTRSMTSLLFAVTAVDPVAFAGASALLAAIALVACALPAARAARSDPAVALREE